MNCTRCGRELTLTTDGYKCKTCGFGVSVGYALRTEPLSELLTREETRQIVIATLKKFVSKLEEEYFGFQGEEHV